MSAFVVAFAISVASSNYLIWRIGVVSRTYWWLSLPLLLAELFGSLHLLGLLYTAWPRPAPQIDVTDDPFALPIFLLIPTVNEGVEVLEPTVRGALATRERYLALHPQARAEIVLCNDGRAAGQPNWQEVEVLAARLGVTCVTRAVGGGAKAGNIEHARQMVEATGEALIVLFDADMVAEPDFLIKTIPPFGDPSVGWVQTGQYYRNLDSPIACWAHDQQLLFYRVLCPGKAAVNGAFICGTNVVIRAAALDCIGGLPQDSVTEDLAASILLHPRWRGLYLTDVLARGLGPADLAAYFTQQRRWATGTFGVLFQHWHAILLPWHKGLSLHQRLQYALCCTHYFGGMRDLVCFLAPLCFLFLGVQALQGVTLASFLVHFLPYWVVSQFAFWHVARGKVGAAAILHGTVLGFGSFPAILSGLWTAAVGRRADFTVTAKQRRETRTWRQLDLHLLMFVICLAGLGFFLKGNQSQWYGLVSALWVLYMLLLLGGMLWLGVQERRSACAFLDTDPSTEVSIKVSPAHILTRLQRLMPLACGFCMVAGVLVSQQAMSWLLASHAASSAYTITEIQTLGGANIFHGGGGMNDNGQVVGRSDTYDARSRAFLWDKGWAWSRMNELGTLSGGQGSTAYAVNDAGEVVGFADTATGDDHAVLWQDGRIRDLGTLPGFRCSVATAINARGQIVGRVYNPRPDLPDLLLWPSRAVLWENGRIKDLGTLLGSTSSRAYGINDCGQVVGWTLTNGNLRRAFLWEKGHMAALKGGAVSAATGINNRGQIIGVSGFSDDTVHAVLWESGQVHDLGTILGHTFNRATAINDQGVVVGTTRTGGEIAPPFIWDAEHGMRSLNSLLPAHSGWYLTQAFGVNARGEVLAWGQYQGNERMCLLSPMQGSGVR